MPERRALPGWLLPASRAVFLGAVVVFAWLGLRGRFDEVADALRDTSVAGVAGALALVLVGLAATGLLWLHLMSCLDVPLPLRPGLRTFFVGQLGKYIPGSVWSIGAQAQMATRYAVPARTTVAAGLVFLGYHLVTGVIVGTLAVLLGELDAPWPDWLSLVALVASTLALVPAVVRSAGERVAGVDLRIGWSDTGLVLVLMGTAWTLYAVAMVLLSPGLPWRDLVALGGAFALAYALGVVIVFAPAGVGAREALFVVLVSPLTSVPAATALALLARVVHTAADGLMAAGWWWAARRGPSVPEP